MDEKVLRDIKMEINNDNQMEISGNIKKKSKKNKLEKKLKKLEKKKLKDSKKEKKKEKEKEKHINEIDNKKDKKEKKKNKDKDKDKEKEKEKELKNSKEKKDKKDKENENNDKKRKLETNDSNKSNKKHKKDKKDKKHKKHKNKDKEEKTSEENSNQFEIRNPVIKELIRTIDNNKANEIKEMQKTNIPSNISISKRTNNSDDNTNKQNFNEINSKELSSNTEISNNNVINSEKLNDNTENQNADKENNNPETNIVVNNTQNNNNSNSNSNNNNNKEKIITRKQDIHYKHDDVAEENLKIEYGKAPSELTDKWRKYDNLKSTGLTEVMKKGPFSNEEKEILKKAVDNYLELHGIDKSLVLNLVFKKQYKNNNVLDMKKHKDFWKYVSKSLPNRPTEASYRCVTRMYHPDNFIGKFTEKDDEEILRLYSIYGPSWQKIGEYIGRMGCAVKDRYNTLQSKLFPGSGSWTHDENYQYEKIIYELYLDNKFVDGMPVFSEVSKRLKTRSPKQCYDHWVFSKKNFIAGTKEPITITDRRNYLEKLSKLRVQNETQVDWKLVVDPSKPWKPFLYSKDFTESKKKYFKNTDDITFNECINRLLQIVNQEITAISNEYIIESDME